MQVSHTVLFSIVRSGKVALPYAIDRIVERQLATLAATLVVGEGSKPCPELPGARTAHNDVLAVLTASRGMRNTPTRGATPYGELFVRVHNYTIAGNNSVSIGKNAILPSTQSISNASHTGFGIQVPECGKRSVEPRRQPFTRQIPQRQAQRFRASRLGSFRLRMRLQNQITSSVHHSPRRTARSHPPPYSRYSVNSYRG